MGAGGGGFLLLFAEPSAQVAVRENLTGLLEVPFELDPLGSQIIFFDRQNDYRQVETRRAEGPLQDLRERSIVSLASAKPSPSV